MIPADALKRIRSVSIHYNPVSCIFGFSFFDKDGALLWKIGKTTASWMKEEIVVLEENEVIVGVVAKLLQDWRSCYRDFQFQIA